MRKKENENQWYQNKIKERLKAVSDRCKRKVNQIIQLEIRKP